MNEDLQAQINELKRRLDAFTSNSTIPFDVGEAFIARVGSLRELSTKTAGSETQAVNEGGVASYNVAKAMDGFLRTADGKNIPYYND